MVYPIARYVIPPIVKLWIRSVTGMKHVPKDNHQFIIACNHASFFDDVVTHVLIVPTINKQVHVFVNSSYWNIPIIGWLLTHWGECIPAYVKQEAHLRHKNQESIERAAHYLRKNEPIQIFPEGGRSKDGRLQKAYYGAARLAHLTGVPIIPMGIKGSFQILPKGALFPRFKRADVYFGKALSFKKVKNPSKQQLQQSTKKIMTAIGNLIGQPYPH